MYLHVLALVPLQTDLYPYIKGKWNMKKKNFHFSLRFWGLNLQVKISLAAGADVGLLVAIISMCRA